MTVPETEDILGMKPRYLLRSGYAGLQFDNATEEKVNNFIGIAEFQKKNFISTII